MYVVKTKALISCVFVFAYAKSRFSHDEAHFNVQLENCRLCYITDNCIMKIWKYSITKLSEYFLADYSLETIFMSIMGEGKDRPSLSPIPVAYVMYLYDMYIYADKNLLINK